MRKFCMVAGCAGLVTLGVPARAWTDPLMTPSALDAISIWEKTAAGKWRFVRTPFPSRTGVQETKHLLQWRL